MSDKSGCTNLGVCDSAGCVYGASAPFSAHKVGTGTGGEPGDGASCEGGCIIGHHCTALGLAGP